MLQFIVALLFGAGQVLLTEQLIIAFNTQEGKKILLFLGAKFLSYGMGVGLVVLKYLLNISLYLCGFAVGVPIAAIGLFVYRTIYKKQDKSE